MPANSYLLALRVGVRTTSASHEFAEIAKRWLNFLPAAVNYGSSSEEAMSIEVAGPSRDRTVSPQRLFCCDKPVRQQERSGYKGNKNIKVKSNMRMKKKSQ